MNVQISPRANLDGNIVSNFTTREGSVAATYTYPTVQDNLEIWNKGSVSMILNVGTYTNQTILAGKKWKNDISFTSFDIKASSGTCEFTATSIDYAAVNSTIIKGATAQRPTATAVIGQEYFDTTLGKPIWKKAAAIWCDATGTVV